MKRNLRLLLIIPLIILFASILVVLFSPVNLIPCETSVSDPATSWQKTNCKGYYLTTNQQPVSQPVIVNNSGFLINLVILICGSFLINGIIFLLLFAFVELKQTKSQLEKWDELADEAEKIQVKNKSLFTRIFSRKKPYEQRFVEENISHQTTSEDETDK